MLRRWASDSAVNLAVFRVAVAVVFLSAQDLWQAASWAARAPGLSAPPEAAAWVWRIAPLTPAAVSWGTAALALALVLGAVGLFTRAAFLAATVLGLWILAVPQIAGFVFHDHHLVWFTALLAASPSGDALSLDARRRGSPPASSALAYGVPIRCAWLLIGAIFLFPGLWKLIASGPEWIFSDNLRNHLFAKWAQNAGFTPWLRVDRHPWLIQLGALFTVVFELAFLPAVLFRRTRPFAVAAALLFHLGTWAFMKLDFSVLYPCYVVFFDWRHVEPPGEDGSRRAWASLAVGAVLIAGAFEAGAAGRMSGWPFACYPTFQWLAKPEMPALAVEVVTRGGEVREVPRPLVEGGSQRAWALAWSLIGALDRPPSEERLRAYWRELGGDPEAARVRFYRAWVSTIPEERGRVLRRVLVAEIEP